MLHLTPDILCGTYDFMRLTLPFRCWKLPCGEEVEFKIGALVDLRGWHTRSTTRDGHHVVGVSKACIGRVDSLMAVMAHEMIHVRQSECETETRNTIHNAEFRRLARLVCKRHGFDLLLF